MRIFAGFPRKVAPNDSAVIVLEDDKIFSAVVLVTSLEISSIKAHIIIQDMRSLVGFSVILNISNNSDSE